MISLRCVRRDETGGAGLHRRGAGEEEFERVDGDTADADGWQFCGAIGKADAPAEAWIEAAGADARKIQKQLTRNW
jgi:hypothetical protein